jgi:arginyl-tRNA synthetase
MEITEHIKELINKALEGIGSKQGNVILEQPREKVNGDYSTNIAMLISKELQKNPTDVAKEIVSNIPKSEYVEKAVVAGSGFINFFVSDTYLAKEMEEISKDDYFDLEEKKGRNIVIEYTDPNPFKILHIGHLYTNIVGESFARLQEALGASVKRVNYQGDVGLHVAKTLWALLKKMNEESITFDTLRKLSLVEKVKYLGDSYMLGFKYYDDLKDEKAIEGINDINYYIFTLFDGSLEKKDFSVYESIDLVRIYEETREWCLEYFETIYQRVGTHFDHYFFESEVSALGLKVVMDNVGTIFKKNGGAIIYEGETKKGLHTRVFVNNYGIPTYEAKDLGLAISKERVMKYDESIIITGNEQAGYFKVLIDALMKVRPDLGGKTKHIPHGMVKLPGAKKMSSRKGEIIEAEWLLNETQSKVKEIISERNVKDADLVSEKVALAAIKYTFLKVGVGRDVIFDFDKSISFDGDTGPYLLYVYARCNSIVRELEMASVKEGEKSQYSTNPIVKDLLKHIGSYKMFVLNSGLSYSPSILCQYLFDLGQKFNTLYQEIRIKETEGSDRDYLMSVVVSTIKVMENGLGLLGIDVIDEM